MFLRFAYYQLLYFIGPLYIMALIYRIKFYRSIRYVYPLGHAIANQSIKRSYQTYILNGLRALTLLCLMVLVMRPQWVDERSLINVHGIDMVIAIDISGSMQAVDDLKDTRQRIVVAKEEAINFVQRRSNDPIGIVVFAADGLSCCPLTLDKQVLKEKISHIDIGMVTPNETFLGTGIATAVNCLKNSQARSKVIILLTDGSPSPSDPITPEQGIEFAQRFGIKIYTIGIGHPEGPYSQDLFGRYFRDSRFFPLNIELLQKIAQSTGGTFFRASNPHDMKIIYEQIDKLEKTDIKTNQFNHYYEAFLKFIWIILLLVSCELILRLYKWRGI